MKSVYSFVAVLSVRPGGPIPSTGSGQASIFAPAGGRSSLSPQPSPIKGEWAPDAPPMYDELVFRAAGDQAVLVELGDEISPDTNARVHNLARAIEEAGVSGVVDLIPAYDSLLVQYDARVVSTADLQDSIRELDSEPGRAEDGGRVVELPVLYGGEHGPDIERVAEHSGLAVDDVVRLHSGTDYLVYMLGFTPGFPYLGGLDDRLATPRVATPRLNIPAGSVGIAESQTGVYPLTSPGGWNIIGRTPLSLFDPTREPPSLLAPGDLVRFVPMDGPEEYARMADG